MKKSIIVFICIMILVLTGTLVSCGGDGGVDSNNATAVFGADQFHLQQTANPDY